MGSLRLWLFLMTFEANSVSSQELHTSPNSWLSMPCSARLWEPGRLGRRDLMVHKGRGELGDKGVKSGKGVNGWGRTLLRDVWGCKIPQLVSAQLVSPPCCKWRVLLCCWLAAAMGCWRHGREQGAPRECRWCRSGLGAPALHLAAGTSSVSSMASADATWREQGEGTMTWEAQPWATPESRSGVLSIYHHQNLECLSQHLPIPWKLRCIPPIPLQWPHGQGLSCSWESSEKTKTNPKGGYLKRNLNLALSVPL